MSSLTKTKADVVIVGGGISGCAALYEMSKAGVGKVVLLDAGKVAGRTTGESGGYIRKFNTDSYLGRLASESFDYYQNFEHEVGVGCDFIQTGLVSRVSASNFETLRPQIDQLRLSGHQMEVSLSAPTKSLREGNYFSGDHVFIYEPTLGNISTVKACRAWVEAAIRIGASLLEDTAVSKILHKDNKIVGVETSSGIIETDAVVLSAGAWSKAMLAALPVENENITARSFQYNIYKGAAKYLDTAFMDNIEGFYTAPFRNGDVFAGTLGQDRLVDEGLIFDHQNDDGIAESLHQAMKKHFSWVGSSESISIQRSYDAYTDDGRGVVKSFAELQGLILASGWSSGGIKSAPAIAKQIRRLVCEKQTALLGV